MTKTVAESLELLWGLSFSVCDKETGGPDQLISILDPSVPLTSKGGFRELQPLVGAALLWTLGSDLPWVKGHLRKPVFFIYLKML